jgi:hypothetical protein
MNTTAHLTALSRVYHVQIKMRVLTGQEPFTDKFYDVYVGHKGEKRPGSDLDYWYLHVGSRSCAEAVIHASTLLRGNL